MDGNDKPYEQCVRRMRAFNRRELYAVAAAAPGENDSVRAASPDETRDGYGGAVAVASRATGFFRVEVYIPSPSSMVILIASSFP